MYHVTDNQSKREKQQSSSGVVFDVKKSMNERIIALAESVGLAWTGELDSSGRPEFLGDKSAWSKFDKQMEFADDLI